MAAKVIMAAEPFCFAADVSFFILLFAA